MSWAHATIRPQLTSPYLTSPRTVLPIGHSVIPFSLIHSLFRRPTSEFQSSRHMLFVPSHVDPLMKRSGSGSPHNPGYSPTVRAHITTCIPTYPTPDRAPCPKIGL